MPFERNQRLDPRRSSQYCSTTTIVVFVALCLVGVWMMTSSTVVPVDMPSTDANSELNQEVREIDSKQFEDSNGNVPPDTRKEEANANSSTEDETRGENYSEGNEGTKDNTADTSKSVTYNDANRNPEGGMVGEEDGKLVKEGGNFKTEIGNTDGEEQAKGKEQTPVTTADTDQEKTSGQISTQMDNNEEAKRTAKNEQDKTTDQTSEKTGNVDKEIKTEQDPTITETDYQNSSTQQNSDLTTSHGEQPDAQKNSDQQSKSAGDSVPGKDDQEHVESTVNNDVKNNEEKPDDETTQGQAKQQGSNELLPSGAQSELLNETNTQTGAWSTQASQSRNEKELQASNKKNVNYTWKLCNTTSGADYIPCLDNEQAIRKLHSTKHYEHRERHCPEPAPTCLVPLPDGYQKPIEWPKSRDKIWYHNVPHTKLAAYKGHQNWVKVSGEYLTFPGGGTQFKFGALHYIDVIQEAVPDIAWGNRSRVILDVGCGVASFGGFLFDRDVLTMSFAPNDEHEAQVQFALERGIPAISAVMGTKRLPFPSRVFDVVHCARCRVPWHIEGGMLMLELNRLLRPGGFFVWSATPIYQKKPEDVKIWKAMSALLKSMCWEMVAKTKDTVDQVGLAIYRKPFNNSCYEERKETSPPFCPESDDPNAAWNVPLQACMHKLPVDPSSRGSKWPENWPLRLKTAPYWLNNSHIGVYGKPSPEDFKADQEHWNTVVSKSYLNGMGIDWSKVRNVMDMRSVYGGFAAALRDMEVWVMNIVPIDSPDTLPIIYERGLFGMYHDWCEGFSTYPRTYDVLHADHLFSRTKKRCELLPLMVEVDRMLRPDGKLIVRDSVDIISEVESIARSLNWEIRMNFSKQSEGILCVKKGSWRPTDLEVGS